MSAHCPGSELLLELSCELLEEEEAARLTAHVSDCLACQAQQDLLGAALAAPPEPVPPAEVLEALHRRIDEAEGRDQPPVPGEEAVVRLLCTYCKDDLLKDEAIFCAGCLAPHHDDCFVEHGRCSIAGCESKTTVRGVDVVKPPKKRKKLKAGLVLLFSGIVGGVGAAALIGDSHVSSVRLGQESALDLTHREETYDVADLVGAVRQRPAAVRRVQEVLGRPAPRMAVEASLRELLEALRQRANLDVRVHTTATALLDRKIVLAGDGLTISAVLSTALRQVGGALRVGRDSFEIRLAGGQPGKITIEETARVDPGFADAEMFGLRVRRTPLDPEGLRLLVRAQCGPVWAPPAAIELRDGRLRVTQTEAQHRTIRKLLTRLSSAAAAPEQPRPWSYPAIAPAEPSPRLGLERWAERLRLTTLTLDQRRDTQLLALVLRLEEAGLPVQVTPRAAELYRSAKITIPIRGSIGAEAALRTAFQSLSPPVAHARLRWEAGLAGVRLYDRDEARVSSLVNTSHWEAKLQEALRRSVELSVTGDLAALVTRLHTLTKIPFALSPRPEVRRVGAIEATLQGPLDTKLDALLAARGLGLQLLERAVWIVPREEANLEPIRVATLLKRRVDDGGLQVGVTVAGLVARLNDLSVRVDPSAARARARMVFPQGLTRGELLELARLQGGIDARISFVGGAPLVTLFGGPAPLSRAHALREELLDPDLPAHRTRIARGLRKPLRQRRKAFDAAFLALHEASDSAGCGFDRIQAAMLALGRADRAVRDLLEVSAALVDERLLERAQRARASAFLAHQSRWNEAVRTNDPRFLDLLRLREQVSAPRLEAVAAEAAWLEALQALKHDVRRSGWSKAFRPTYADWKAGVRGDARARVRLGLARLRRLGVAFDLEERHPRVVAVLPGRAGAAAGIRVGDRMRRPKRFGTWDLLWSLGAPQRAVSSFRFERSNGHVRFTIDLGPTKPQGPSNTRR